MALGVAALIVILLTFFKTIGHEPGFIALTVIVFVKLGANLLRNIVLKPEQTESSPPTESE